MASRRPASGLHVPSSGEAVEPSVEFCEMLELAPTSSSQSVQLVFDHFVSAAGDAVSFVCKTRHARSTGGALSSWLIISDDEADLLGWCMPPQEVEGESPPPLLPLFSPLLSQDARACRCRSVPCPRPICRSRPLATARRSFRPRRGRKRGASLLPLSPPHLLSMSIFLIPALPMTRYFRAYLCRRATAPRPRRCLRALAHELGAGARGPPHERL